MKIREIKSPEDLTKVLIVAGGYLLKHGLREAEITCGKLRVKVVAELMEKAEDD